MISAWALGLRSSRALRPLARRWTGRAGTGRGRGLGPRGGARSGLRPAVARGPPGAAPPALHRPQRGGHCGGVHPRGCRRRAARGRSGPGRRRCRLRPPRPPARPSRGPRGRHPGPPLQPTGRQRHREGRGSCRRRAVRGRLRDALLAAAWPEARWPAASSSTSGHLVTRTFGGGSGEAVRPRQPACQLTACSACVELPTPGPGQPRRWRDRGQGCCEGCECSECCCSCCCCCGESCCCDCCDCDC